MNKLQIMKLGNNTYAAVFTGTDGSGSTCTEEEAHNLQGESRKDREQEALFVWGLAEHETEIEHIA